MDHVDDPANHEFAPSGCFSVAACRSRLAAPESTMPEFTVFDPREQRQRDRSGTFTGRDGITIFGTGNSEAAAAGGGRGRG